MRLRDLIQVFGVVPRANLRPTDLGPVILPEYDGFACRELRWGWGVPWDKSPLINAKSETLSTLATFRPHLNERCLLLADGFYEKGVLFRQTGGGVFCLEGLRREESGVNKYTMLDEESGEMSVVLVCNRCPKPKYAGKLQDKQIVVGVRELTPFGGRLRARGAIISGPEGK